MSAMRKVVLATIVTVSLLFISFNSGVAGDKLRIQIGCPTITSNVQFNMLIRAINKSNQAIIFNKLVIAYANPDMTIKGPYLVRNYNPPISVPAASNYDLVVPFTINTQQPSGGLVPILVTLWYQNITTGCERGAGAGAAIVK